MTTTNTRRYCGPAAGHRDSAGRSNLPTAGRLLRPVPVLLGLLFMLAGVTACDNAATQVTSPAEPNPSTPGRSSALSSEAVEACQKVFARTDASGTQIIVIWDATASVADMSFPAVLAEDLKAASLADGTLSIIAVDGKGVAPRILAKNVALSTSGERDRPSVAKLAEVMPDCVQAVYLNGLVPTAPGTDLHRAMALAAEIVHPDATLWTVSDMLSTAGQLVLTKDALSQPADEAAKKAAATAPIDLHDAVWQVSGVANASTPLLGANQEWMRDFTRSLCRSWNAKGCAAIKLDPVNPVRTVAMLPKDPIPPFPSVAEATSASSCSFTLPDVLTFAGGSAKLRRSADEVLARPLALLEANPNATLRIVGHTASSSAYTARELMALSKARSESVRDRILHAGIDEARVTTRGVGDTEPMAEDIDPVTGLQIPEIAAAERRVALTIKGAACSR